MYCWLSWLAAASHLRGCDDYLSPDTGVRVSNRARAASPLPVATHTHFKPSSAHNAMSPTLSAPRLVVALIAVGSYAAVFLLVYLPVWIILRKQHHHSLTPIDCKGQPSDIALYLSCDEDENSWMATIDRTLFDKLHPVMPLDPNPTGRTHRCSKNTNRRQPLVTDSELEHLRGEADAALPGYLRGIAQDSQTP